MTPEFKEIISQGLWCVRHTSLYSDNEKFWRGKGKGFTRNRGMALFQELEIISQSAIHEFQDFSESWKSRLVAVRFYLKEGSVKQTVTNIWP